MEMYLALPQWLRTKLCTEILLGYQITEFSSYTALAARVSDKITGAGNQSKKQHVQYILQMI